MALLTVPPRIKALEQLSALGPAPSVALQDTPRESLLDELGFSKESTERDSLDESLARMFINLSDGQTY